MTPTFPIWDEWGTCCLYFILKEVYYVLLSIPNFIIIHTDLCWCYNLIYPCRWMVLFQRICISSISKYLFKISLNVCILLTLKLTLKESNHVLPLWPIKLRHIVERINKTWMRYTKHDLIALIPKYSFFTQWFLVETSSLLIKHTHSDMIAIISIYAHWLFWQCAMSKMFQK